MKRSVLVTLADKDYIDQAKQLFSSVYWHGDWKGDYLLLACGIPESDLVWFSNKGIFVKEFEPLEGMYLQQWPSTITGKFQLFTPYFKQWETVVFLDADIIVRDSIASLANTRGFAAVSDIGKPKLSGHFMQKGSFILDDLKKNYDLSVPAFNSGVFAFSTDIITDDSFIELMRLSNEYNFITLYFDQCILNLFFYNKWRWLSYTYNIQVANIKTSLSIKNQSIDGTILHFITRYKPWHGRQYFYDEWNANLAKAQFIDLMNRPVFKKRSFNVRRFFFLKTLSTKLKLFRWIETIREKTNTHDDFGVMVQWWRNTTGKTTKDSIGETTLANLLWIIQQKYEHLKRLFMFHRLDKKSVPYASHEIRLFMCIKNEYTKLPYVYEQYRRLGVDRFFVVDNGSTDGTLPFLLSQKNTHVWQTSESFRKAKFGSEWLKILLNKYGKGQWCVVVDADEVFVYPHYETINLKQLAQFLEQEGATAVESVLLDMYAEHPISEAKIQTHDLAKDFPFFDTDAYYTPRTKISEYYAQSYNTTLFAGGMRERVFGVTCWLNKIPFLKYTPMSPLHYGQHFIKNATLSGVRGATLHFKYDAGFISRVQEEAEREEHWQYAAEYKLYTRKVFECPTINPYYEGSVKFKDSRQLVDFNIVKTTKTFEDFANLPHQ